MSLSDLAAIGSFISGIAVVISFIFLTLQLRQTAQNQRATVHNERTKLVQDYLAQVSDVDNAEVFVRGRDADKSLSPSQTMSFIGQTLVALLIYEELFYQHRDGMLDDTRWAAQVRRARFDSNSPGYRAAWRLIADGGFFEADFKQWYEAVMREDAMQLQSSVPAQWHRLAAAELDKMRTSSTPAVEA